MALDLQTRTIKATDPSIGAHNAQVETAAVGRALARDEKGKGLEASLAFKDVAPAKDDIKIKGPDGQLITLNEGNSTKKTRQAKAEADPVHAVKKELFKHSDRTYANKNTAHRIVGSNDQRGLLINSPDAQVRITGEDTIVSWPAKRGHENPTNKDVEKDGRFETTYKGFVPDFIQVHGEKSKVTVISTEDNDVAVIAGSDPHQEVHIQDSNARLYAVNGPKNPLKVTLGDKNGNALEDAYVNASAASGDISYAGKIGKGSVIIGSHGADKLNSGFGASNSILSFGSGDNNIGSISTLNQDKTNFVSLTASPGEFSVNIGQYMSPSRLTTLEGQVQKFNEKKETDLLALPLKERQSLLRDLEAYGPWLPATDRLKLNALKSKTIAETLKDENSSPKDLRDAVISFSGLNATDQKKALQGIASDGDALTRLLGSFRNDAGGAGRAQRASIMKAVAEAEAGPETLIKALEALRQSDAPANKTLAANLAGDLVNLDELRKPKPANDSGQTAAEAFHKLPPKLRTEVLESLFSGRGNVSVGEQLKDYRAANRLLELTVPNDTNEPLLSDSEEELIRDRFAAAKAPSDPATFYREKIATPLLKLASKPESERNENELFGALMALKTAQGIDERERPGAKDILPADLSKEARKRLATYLDGLIASPDHAISKPELEAFKTLLVVPGEA